MTDFDNLARCLHIVAGLHLAFELGAQTVETLNGKWFPGCGHPLGIAVVECEWCSCQYQSMGDPIKNQGLDCAAATYQKGGRWYLQGFYGSGEADMQIYEWHGWPYDGPDPSGKPMDPICDNCIRYLRNKGVLMYVEEGQP